MATAVTIAAMVAAWSLSPAGLRLADLGVLVGIAAAAAYLIGALSANLRRTIPREAAARREAERRSALLGVVGRATTLDTERALDVIVDAVVTLGFDLANIAIVRGAARHAVATRGAAPPPVTPTHAGVTGRCLREERTVVVDDYATDPDRLPSQTDVTSAVATPVRVDGAVVGVLVGARAGGEPPSVADVEMLEVLAEHTGHAIANAQRFTDEREVVERLRQLDTMKRGFVSNVSHELRTPLTVVQGLGRTLQQRGGGLSEAQWDELLGRIHANADRLAGMLAGLLDFSRFEHGAMRVDRTPVRLGPLARRVIDRLDTVLVGREVSLRTSSGELAVDGDPALLEHVVENLLLNAAKHTPPGTRIEVTVTPVQGGLVEFAVRDDGPGIPPEELPRLSQRFFRGRRSTSTVRGAGLGLALTAEILSAHGCQLDISSAVGHGATFAFRLPAVAHAEGPS